MPEKIRCFLEVMAEEEERRAHVARAEIAAEDAEWAALPQAERERINAEREAKWAAFEDACANAPDSDEDDEDEDEEG